MGVLVQIVEIEAAKRIANIMGPSSAHAQALAEIASRPDEDLLIVRPSGSRDTILVIRRDSLISTSVDTETPWTEHTDPG
jgi:hypothetical protein